MESAACLVEATYANLVYVVLQTQLRRIVTEFLRIVVMTLPTAGLATISVKGIMHATVAHALSVLSLTVTIVMRLDVMEAGQTSVMITQTVANVATNVRRVHIVILISTQELIYIVETKNSSPFVFAVINGITQS